MFTNLRRGLLGLAVLAATAAVLPTSAAHAEDQPFARFTMSGDGFIAGSSSYAYTTPSPTTSISVAWRGDGLHVDVYGRSQLPRPWPSDTDHVMLDVTGDGPLAAGAYDTPAAMELSGIGRGCGSGNAGSFTIHRLSVVGGVLQQLDLTFEHYCVHNPAAASRGRVLYGYTVDEMPPLPTIVDQVKVVAGAVPLTPWMPTRSLLKVRVPRYHGGASGAVLCTRGGTFTVTGEVSQNSQAGQAKGTFSTSGVCTGQYQQWTAVVRSTTGVSFTIGEAWLAPQVYTAGEPVYLLGGASYGLLPQSVVASPQVTAAAKAHATGSLPAGPTGIASPDKVRRPSLARRSPGGPSQGR